MPNSPGRQPAGLLAGVVKLVVWAVFRVASGMRFPRTEPLVIHSPVCAIEVRRKALLRCNGRFLACPGARRIGSGRSRRGQMSPSRALAAGREFSGIGLPFGVSRRKKAFFLRLTEGNFVEIVILCYFSWGMSSGRPPVKADGPGGNAPGWEVNRPVKYQPAFFGIWSLFGPRNLQR